MIKEEAKVKPSMFKDASIDDTKSFRLQNNVTPAKLTNLSESDNTSTPRPWGQQHIHPPAPVEEEK